MLKKKTNTNCIVIIVLTEILHYLYINLIIKEHYVNFLSDKISSNNFLSCRLNIYLAETGRKKFICLCTCQYARAKIFCVIAIVKQKTEQKHARYENDAKQLSGLNKHGKVLRMKLRKFCLVNLPKYHKFHLFKIPRASVCNMK